MVLTSTSHNYCNRGRIIHIRKQGHLQERFNASGKTMRYRTGPRAIPGH